MTEHYIAVPKLLSGIDGLDQVTLGGIPQGRTTLLTGSTGTGKTQLALEFLARGIQKYGEPGVFVTFAEPPEDIRVNAASFGMDVEGWEAAGTWTFVDASELGGDLDEFVGSYDLSALLARLADAVQRVSAVRVSLDSIGAVFSRFNDSRIVRLELTRTARTLRELNVTAVLTSERTEEYGAISRFEVEEFVADNVVILRNVLDREKRRRTLEVLKLRGSPHRTGEWLFTIDPVKGLVVLPLALLGMDQPPSSERVSAGVPELDRMFAGGLFRDSVAFVAGPTGTGKTLLATHFIQAGVDAGERCVIFSFEDTREQLLRNAASWGFDLEAMEATGRLQIMCEYPELASLEDHYLSVTRLIEEFKPQRLVVDNMSALERVTSERGMRDVVIGLGAFVKQRQITTLFTASTDIVGGSGMTEAHLSTLTDAIVLLRYVEMDAEMRRAITVLKMLGSSHDHAIREYTIGDAGVTIGEPLKGAGGFLPPSGGNGSAGGAGGS